MMMQGMSSRGPSVVRRDFGSRNGHRRAVRWSVSLGLGLLTTLPWVAAVAGADEPMQLSNRHIGMSKAEVEAEMQAAEDAGAAESRTLVMAADADGNVTTNEWRSEPADPEGEHAQGWEVGDDAVNFERCVARSTEAGNGRDESERVCGVIFPPPEPTPAELAAKALAEAQARAAEAQKLAEQKQQAAVEAAQRAEELRLAVEQAQSSTR